MPPSVPHSTLVVANVRTVNAGGQRDLFGFFSFLICVALASNSGSRSRSHALAALAYNAMDAVIRRRDRPTP